jgi:hypothetical protein
MLKIQSVWRLDPEPPFCSVQLRAKASQKDSTAWLSAAVTTWRSLATGFSFHTPPASSIVLLRAGSAATLRPATPSAATKTLMPSAIAPIGQIMAHILLLWTILVGRKLSRLPKRAVRPGVFHST